ncbi:MAG TPA: hypothetical protein VD926_04100 [Acidimicrobiales bacterium]|nr:hypothetical protein [Acidimicrobiales bacterium]
MARIQELLRRAAALLDRASATTETPRGRRLSLLASAVVFVVAMVLSARGLPEGDRDLAWWAILVTGLVGIPSLILLSGVEYTAAAAVLGHRVRLRDSLAIALYARAANLLPIPGAALVRMQALKRAGSSYKRAASATMATALFWLAGALLVGGAVLVPHRWLIAAGFLAGGVLTTVLAHVAVRSIVTRREDATPGEAVRRSALLLAVEVAMVAIRGSCSGSSWSASTSEARSRARWSCRSPWCWPLPSGSSPPASAPARSSPPASPGSSATRRPAARWPAASTASCRCRSWRSSPWRSP